jgi:hypothetical protein
MGAPATKIEGEAEVLTKRPEIVDPAKEPTPDTPVEDDDTDDGA